MVDVMLFENVEDTGLKGADVRFGRGRDILRDKSDLVGSTVEENG